MKNELFAYALDFTNILLDNLGEDSQYLKEVILFGSVARGDFNKDSDMDIFVNVSRFENKIEKKISQSKKQFEERCSKSWHLRGISLPINCVVGNLDSKEWVTLKREIISSGITLFGKYTALPEGLKHYMFFKINLAGLPLKDKVKVVRTIYGYTSNKKKVYEHEGLLDKVHGLKLGLGTVAVPIESYSELYNFLKTSKARFEVKEIWM